MDANKDIEELSHFLGSASLSSIHSSVSFSSSVVSDTTTLLTLKASEELKFESKGYDRPHHFVSFEPSKSHSTDDLKFIGFQASEFGLPVIANDTKLDFELFDRPKFHRPKSILPLIVKNTQSGEVCLLAPVNNFHAQILTVGDTHTLKWGISGDLELIPKHFDIKLAVIVVKNKSIDLAFQIWAQDFILPGRNTDSVEVDRDISFSKFSQNNLTVKNYLSYWTDNGSAYWYRTENSNQSIKESIFNAVKYIEEKVGFGIQSIELDSWFYPHEITREIRTFDYMHIVPPTGMIKWEPRADIFDQKKGLVQFNEQFSSPKSLVLHTRHISSRSEYIENEEEWFINADRAHPKENQDQLWNTWFSQAKSWGASTIEHDWIVEVWQGILQLRQRHERINEWFNSFVYNSEKIGVSLIWCMTTPLDNMLLCQYNKNYIVRTCDDYRYSDDPSTLWRWHLTSSMIFKHLKLVPFKDVFMSFEDKSLKGPTMDGDPYAWIEACLSTLSTGPLAIGDRIHKTSGKILSACCRKDGLIIKPEVPLSISDCSLFDFSRILWASSSDCQGLWDYVFATVTSGKWPTALNDQSKAPTEEWPEEIYEQKHAALVFDWVNKVWCTNNNGKCRAEDMKVKEWRYWVVCPQLKIVSGDIEAEFSFVGDVNSFATMSQSRIRIISGIKEESQTKSKSLFVRDHFIFDVIGLPEEVIDIGFWLTGNILKKTSVTISGKGWSRVRLSPNFESNQENYISIEIVG